MFNQLHLLLFFYSVCKIQILTLEANFLGSSKAIYINLFPIGVRVNLVLVILIKFKISNNNDSSGIITTSWSVYSYSAGPIFLNTLYNKVFTGNVFNVTILNR